MKIILQLVFIVNCLDSLMAQTYISPTIGYDFANMTTIDNVEYINYINLADKKYGVDNFTIGLKLRQKINEKFDIVIHSNFSKKYSAGWTFNILPFNTVQFNYLQNGLQLNYNYKSYFCAVGGNINILSDGKISTDKNKVVLPFLDKISEKGMRIAVGKYYKHFCAEAYFYKGLTANLDNRAIYLLPIESFGILVSYDIKIFDKFKRKTKAACPKF